jgi:hypothetical protein
VLIDEEERKEDSEMNEYNAVMIARTEHELMVRSIAPVSEYGENVISEQPGWVSQQAGRVLSFVGNELAALGERLEHGQNAVIESAQSKA